MLYLPEDAPRRKKASWRRFSARMKSRHEIILDPREDV